MQQTQLSAKSGDLMMKLQVIMTRQPLIGRSSIQCKAFNPYWRRKKKSVPPLMQNKAIDIMEDVDCASSSRDASDSEIYLQDANDEEGHYHSSSSISKLQFGCFQCNLE